MEKLIKNLVRTIINSIPFIAIMVAVMLVTSFLVNLADSKPVEAVSNVLVEGPDEIKEEVSGVQATEITLRPNSDLADDSAVGSSATDPEKDELIEVSRDVNESKAESHGHSETIAKSTDKNDRTGCYAYLRDILTEEDLDILTRLVYHESRGIGGEAVIEVVFNRMADKRFKETTLQGVVYAPGQFEPAKNLYVYQIKEPKAFENCKAEVEKVLSSDYVPVLPEYYVFFNNYSAGKTDDYMWQGGNVFFGVYNF